jgi:hypothetical protein
LKENLQKLIFPSGITYCIKNEAFQTEKVNFVFAVNAELNSLSAEDINKQGGIKATLSSSVGKTGFEPATPWSQTIGSLLLIISRNLCTARTSSNDGYSPVVYLSPKFPPKIVT